MNTTKLFATTAAVSLCAAMGTASADVISAQLTPPAPSFTLENLGTTPGNGYLSSSPIPIAGGSITFAGGSSSTCTGPCPSGLYVGNVGSENASPFGVSNSTNDYLVAQPGGSVTITFTTPQTSFDLLWGTVDITPADYNQLQFGAGGETISGGDINNALIADGVAGGISSGAANVAVEIAGLSPFTTITASDGDPNMPAFEFVPGVPDQPAPVSDPPAPVPEPASFALLGTALAGLGFRHRRSNAA